MSDLEVVQQAAREAAEDPEYYPYAMLVIGAAVWGPDPAKLARITGIDRKLVDQVTYRMAANGLWTNEGVVAAWADGGEDSGLALQMDILVARGFLAVSAAPQEARDERGSAYRMRSMRRTGY